MRPYPRIRKLFKWGGAAMTVLLTTVWIGSGWFGISLNVTDRIVLGAFRGTARLRYTRDEHFNRLTADYLLGFHRDFVLEWSFLWREYGDDGFIDVPLWIGVGIAIVITVIAFRLDTLARRRERMHLCVNCHYDRAGLAADARCPECGAAPVITHTKAKTTKHDTNAHG